MNAVQKEIKHSEKGREITMLYSMICKQHRHEEKRFWFCQERRFVMPASELQIVPYMGVFRMNIR